MLLCWALLSPTLSSLLHSFPSESSLPKSTHFFTFFLSFFNTLPPSLHIPFLYCSPFSAFYFLFPYAVPHPTFSSLPQSFSFLHFSQPCSFLHFPVFPRFLLPAPPSSTRSAANPADRARSGDETLPPQFYGAIALVITDSWQYDDQ